MDSFCPSANLFSICCSFCSFHITCMNVFIFCSKNDIISHINNPVRRRKKHLNQYNGPCLDITWVISTTEKIHDMVLHLQKEIINERSKSFPCTLKEGRTSFCKTPTTPSPRKNIPSSSLDYSGMGTRAVKQMTETAYMTGLLPIKNMAHNQFLTDFYEYTMVQPEPLEKYTRSRQKKTAGHLLDTDRNL